jgi:hypothetical protein
MNRFLIRQNASARGLVFVRWPTFRAYRLRHLCLPTNRCSGRPVWEATRVLIAGLAVAEA